MSGLFVLTLSDVIGLFVVALLFIAWLVVSVIGAIAQSRCKHDGGVGETSACDAICNKCGKNLGFIGKWRATHQQQTKDQ